MRRLAWIPIFLFPLVLGGCAEWVARAMEDASYLHFAGRAYVMEIHDLRRAIRRECWASVMREADELRRNGGNEAEFRKMIGSHYPGLVTIDAIKALRDSTTDAPAAAPGC